MIKIYHNPRCTKSRQALQLLEEKGLAHQVVKYMDVSMKEIEKVCETLKTFD